MFNKEIITELFTKRNGQNFLIKTNEGNGHGINGVDFSSFVGYREWKRNGYGETQHYISSTIIELADSYMVLETKTDDGYMRGTKQVVVPYDTITSIHFIVSVKDGYPSDIERNKLFEVKKGKKKAV